MSEPAPAEVESEQDDLPEDDWPYCQCDNWLTVEESDWGACMCCGKPLN